jgi:hypothetical protein
MSSVQPDSSPGPVIVAARVLLMKRLVVDAIRTYQSTLSFCDEINAIMPEHFRHHPAQLKSADEECRAWWRLFLDAMSTHDIAQGQLAALIVNLYDYLAPEDRKLGAAGPGSGFLERGVTIDGKSFIAVDDPADFEAGHPIIAVITSNRVIDLD